MGDDLGDEWWKHEGNSDVSEAEEEIAEEKEPTEKPNTQTKTGKKRKSVTEKPAKAKKRKKSEQKECLVAQEEKKPNEDDKSTKPKKRRKKKKTITDVLASSEPKPGCPADLQNLVTQYFSDKRSVIELEELKLQDSCFLNSNDLTHSLSSYLKEICPKWAKIQKQHTEKSSVVLLIVCSSALRTIELIKQLTTFKGEAKVLKLFAKHIKVEEQVKLLQKGITHIGVGTPGRLSALIEKEGLNMQALRYLVLDWNWRDQKLRRMVDVPEVKVDFLKLLDTGILNGCKEGKVKIGLF
ncbi:protein CMSS1 isoform X1 [Centroberyx gerrardi]|uniref:protein CMSS1 isoform X4 n=1 Tax=Centroberyx gerrardi TaxID=166262 RepID=UPI003AAF5284